MTTPTRLRHLATGIALAALAVGTAACAADDAASSATTAAERAGLSAAACDAGVELNGALGQMPQDPEELGGFVADVLVPAAERLAAGASGDLAEATTTVQEAYASVAETGDPSALFEDEEVLAATAAVGHAVHTGCGLASVDVTAVDYGFEGVDDELEAGPTSFELVNEGSEEHELVLLRRADDATETWEELAELPEEEMMEKATFVGVAFGAPGSTSYTAVDLEPGTYFVVCNIPTGGEEDGAPHAAHGMVQTVTVS